MNTPGPFAPRSRRPRPPALTIEDTEADARAGAVPAGGAVPAVGPKARGTASGVTSASIEDVARLAGVSIATVSRSLRGLPEVAPATRDRVLNAAAELNYVASPFAARLASGRTGTVGVVVPFVNRWFFAEILGAVEGELGGAGYDLLLYNLADHKGRERFFSQLPVRKRVDALMVVSLQLTESEERALAELQLPIGVIGTESPSFRCVRIDDAAGARTAVEHLIAMGHTRIGLIGGDTDDPMAFTPPMHRRDGYVRAMTGAGLSVEPALETLGYFTIEGGESAMRRLLELPDPPTAVFAESDEMAYGAMRAVRRAGLRIPQDVALAGFDDQAMAELMDLTTVRQPVAEQGAALARDLLDSVGRSRASGATTGCAVLTTQLVVRGSTDITKSVY